MTYARVIAGNIEILADGPVRLGELNQSPSSLTAAQLTQFNLMPVRELYPAGYNCETQRLGPFSYTVDATGWVIGTCVALPLPPGELNAKIYKQMDAADLKIIRALGENDAARIAAHKIAQAALRAQLQVIPPPVVP